MTKVLPFVLLAALAVSPRPTVGQSQSEPKVEGSRIFNALGLNQGQTIAEIGAGNGDLTIEAARIVGPQGKVFTSELGESRVQALERAVKRAGMSHIAVIAGDPLRANLPDLCCDAIFMRNVYHPFSDPPAMNASLFRALKPGGRLAIVDFTPIRGRPEAARPADRAENDSHGVTAETVSRELTAVGFEGVVSEPEKDRLVMVVGVKPAR